MLDSQFTTYEYCKMVIANHTPPDYGIYDFEFNLIDNYFIQIN